MSRRHQDRRDHGRRGHTVLELIIALAVLSTTFIIAAELLLARERQLARAGKTAQRINAEGAFDQLHRDLRNARAAPGGGGALSTIPLVLEQADGAIITWRRNGSTLLRGRVDRSGDQGERPALDRVDRFAWRIATTVLRPMVEVEIGFEAPEARIGSGVIGQAPVVQDVRRLTVALRGSGGQAW